jgi:hypothetical protein
MNRFSDLIVGQMLGAGSPLQRGNLFFPWCPAW